MLTWAFVFFGIALIAALFGFTGIAIAADGIAKILFFIFLVVFVVTLLLGLFGMQPPAPLGNSGSRAGVFRLLNPFEKDTQESGIDCFVSRYYVQRAMA